MITGYTIFRPDSEPERGEIDWPASPSLEEIHALCDPLIGGPLERVFVLDPAEAEAEEVTPADYRDMIVDDIAHYRQNPRRNEAATKIYRANYLRANPGTHPETLPWIAGTAVLFDRRIWR